ncbi:MAG: OsmC family protein [Coriobacteriia bacterium]|nr:OsmC family protein [Coriobacteriia bacterium]
MDTVKVRWNGKRQFVAWDEAGHGVVMDAKPEYSGDGTGASPVQLVLYALAGCTGMDVVSILEKKRQMVLDLEIEVRGTKRTEEYPKIYEHIEVEYIVTGIGVKPEAVARAIELSEEKYCSVKGMFGPQVEVVTSFTVREAELPGE